MFCKRCGAQLPADGLFCTNCGTRNETQGEKRHREQVATSKLVREQFIAPTPPDDHKNDKSNRGLTVALLSVLLAIFVICIALLVVLLNHRTDKTDTGVTAENTVQTDAETEKTSAPTEPETEHTTEPETEQTTEPETEQTTEPETTEALQSSSGGFGEYVYDGDYLIIGSDSRYITEDDISWMTERDMQMAINEIYARNGRRFNSPEIRAYFESKSWYHGSILPDDFTEGILNEYERANIAFLLEHQNG
ncbi:MAG: YARHG domain-containing protein [Faecousia sp.]